jgi:hypothetical protein
MKKIQYIHPLLLSFAFFFLVVIKCASTTKPPEKPRLVATTASNSAIFACDTVEFGVEPIFAPALIKCYVWSFDGGKHYPDTTTTNLRKKTWNVADSGIYAIAVKVIDSRGVESDSIVFHVTVTLCKPSISIISDTLIDFNSPSTLLIVNDNSCKHVINYYWSFNGGLSYSDSTLSGQLTKQWDKKDTGRTINVMVKAQIVPGFFTDPASLRIHVVYCRPKITIIGDNLAYTYDSTRFAIVTSSPCDISRYLWSFHNGSVFTDSTFVPVFYKRFQPPDTGAQIVLAAATTSSGILSLVDTFRIIVRSNIFKVTLPVDTSVHANDTIAIRAQVTSTHTTPNYFLWSIDNASQPTKTDLPILISTWQQAGPHTITVFGVDINGRNSSIDSMNVLVRSPLAPSLTPPHDTLIRARDSLSATVTASAVHGTIVRYYWNIGGALSWMDSSTIPQRKFGYQGKDTMTVLVGAKDQQGTIGIDSFHIFFNSPPTNIQMVSPTINDTICLRATDSTFARGIIPFTFSATDKNGPLDTLTYLLYLGKHEIPDSLHKVYEGHDTSFHYSKIDTTTYYWKLVVKDRIGDSCSTHGSFTCLLQKTICFAGHSIIVGIGGAPDSGGIRKKVLSALRAHWGANPLSVKSVGPLPTGYLTPKADDSCFAVSSYRAKDLWLLMKNAFPLLNADMWVLMLGVNDSYSYNNEFRQLLWIIDTINVHNPQATTCVINGLPYKLASGQDAQFNKMLSDSIAARQKAQRKIWNIDAFKAFAINDTANPALFFAPENPYLHPNQMGYDTLAGMVLDSLLKAP